MPTVRFTKKYLGHRPGSIVDCISGVADTLIARGVAVMHSELEPPKPETPQPLGNAIEPGGEPIEPLGETAGETVETKPKRRGRPSKKEA